MNASKNKNLTGKGQKQADLVMQTSLHLLPLIMNNIPQAVFWKDRNLVYLGCNQAFADDAGVSSPEEVVGKTDLDMPWKDQAELYRVDNRRVIETGEPKLDYEEPQTMPNGSTNWVRTSLIPVREDGQVVAVLGMYEDITERKQAEEALKASEANLSILFDANPTGMVLLERENRTIVRANPAAVNMIGAPKEEVIGRICHGFMCPAESTRCPICDLGQTVDRSERMLVKADGSQMPILKTVVQVKLGGKDYLLESFIDNTERKQVEQNLRLQSAALESAANAIVITDRKGSITWVNSAFTRLTGYTAEEAIGNNPRTIKSGKHSEDFYRELWETILAGRVWHGEIINRRKDGTEYLEEMTITPVRDERGEITHFAAIKQDVTARKQAEEVMRESEERFRRFTEATAEGLVFHEKGKIIDANPAALAMYGLSDSDQFIGRNLLEFITPEAHPLVLKQMQLETVLPYEIQCFRADGSTFPVETSTRIYKTGERVIRASSIRDITERKRADQALRENQQLLQLVMDNIPQSVFWKNKDLTYLGVNQSFAEDAGFTSPQEIVGRDDFDMPWKEQAELYRADDQRVLEGGEPKLNYEEPQTGPTGQVTWLRTSKIPMRDANGNIFAVLGMYEDITERKRAEQALRESQQLLQTVMDNIPLSVFWKDTQLNYLGCNRAFAADVALVSPSDVVSLTDFDLPSADRAEHYRADDSLVMNSGIPKINFEEPQTTPDGETNWLRTSKIPMRDAEGKVFAMLGLYEDITEQKRLQQRVQDLFERRGYQVQVSTEISQEVAAAPELNELFELVVTLTKERLGYYHTQLLRYSTAQDAVVLISGYGETGHKMLADGHKMPMGSGLIGTAAASGQTVLRSTLTDDPDWHPNPLLPETKGEIAVPIKWQDTVLGVLDVQSDRAGALTEDDQLLLEGLCGQIAIAMHNAELVETVRQNEARLAEALKTARLANWEYDVEKDFFTFNDQFYSIFHTTAEKVGGYKLTSARYAELFVHPDDMEVVGIEIGKALNSTERVYNTSIDHRILYADGGVGYITVKLTVERDENGKITRYYGANQDITERKQAEMALAEALKTARLANWEYDVEKDLFTFNDQFYSIFHTTAEKAGGYQLSSARYAELFVHPDDLEVVGTEIGKALSSKERVYNTSIDHRIKYADGGVGYITVKLTVERDEDGKITRYYGANQDITERKQAEEALRINEARLAEALKIARLGNWEYDFENDLFHFTDEFYSIFRTTAEKVGGYKISSADYAKHFVHPDDAPLVGAEIQRVLDAKDRLFTTHLEHRIIFADGETGYISVNINVERDENGKITRWYGANQDITERKQTEARLAEALTAARLANWEYDVEKDLFTFNDQFYSIFHTTAEKVGGYQLSSARYSELLVHPDDLPMVGTEIGKALSSTERVYNATLDHRILYADGGVGYITVKLTVERDENGKITRYYGANQDITEQRKVQEELAERLEEINRLYQNLSHEGWKAYRETADLPSGFVFDQTGTRPADAASLPEESFAQVPMKVLGGEVVGNLAVADDPQHPISNDDLDFLQQVSDQVALALEGARLSAQTQSALAQTEKLSEAGLQFTRATDLQELVAIAVDTLGISTINRAALETFNYNSANEMESMDVVANWWSGKGPEPTSIGTHYTAEILPILKLFLSPTPLFVRDAFEDERVDPVTFEIVKRLNIHAFAILPLYLGSQQTGVLVLESEEPYDFKQDEIRLFSAMGPQISTVLENRRQFERAQKQAERESMLNVISQKIQSATSVEAVLQIAARELGHALGAPMTIAQLSMKDKK